MNEPQAMATSDTSPVPLPRRTGGTRILCVDDEPNILKGLSRQLHGYDYEVLTAHNAAEALEVLHGNKSVAVVIADMRMPGADGAALLRLSRKFVPDAARIVLTGHADTAAAAAAVNQGQVFAFLEKPCAASTLIATVDAAVARYRLALAHSLLLEYARQTISDAESALDELFARVSRSFGNDYIAMGLNNAATWPPERIYTSGLDQSLFEQQDQLPAALAVVQERLGPMQLQVQLGQDEVSGLPDGHPWVGRLLAVPLATNLNCYGWMYFADRRRTEPFLPEDEQAAATVATACTLLCESLYREVATCP